MSIINDLIYNRSSADVEEVKALRDKILAEGITSLTEGEYSAWMGGMRGAYNYTDLNRVGETVNFVKAELEALDIHPNVTGKDDWTVSDTPSVAQMQTYLENVQTLKDALPITTEATPATMRWLTIDKMNAIEKILYDLHRAILLTQEAWLYSGEVCSGES